MTTPSIIDELVLMSPAVKSAMAELVAAIVKEKEGVPFHPPIQDFPVPRGWDQVHGYGHEQGSKTFIETLATELAQEEEDDGNPHCYQDILQLEIQFLTLKLEIAKKLKNTNIEQKKMCDIWENIEKCVSIQELKDIVF
jgi:hypothetical protein